MELSIANLSWLSEDKSFLLQVSQKSDELYSFIKDKVPEEEKGWLKDLKSWELNNKWLLPVSKICLKEYDQVFFDCGEELFDLNNEVDYQKFREKIIENLI